MYIALLGMLGCLQNDAPCLFTRKAADEERCCFGTIESLLNMLLFSLFALAAVALMVVVPCVVVCSGGPVLVCRPLELLILTPTFLLLKLSDLSGKLVDLQTLRGCCRKCSRHRRIQRLEAVAPRMDVLVFDRTGFQRKLRFEAG